MIVFDELPEYQENEIPMSEVLKLGDKFMKENPGALEERYKSIHLKGKDLRMEGKL